MRFIQIFSSVLAISAIAMTHSAQGAEVLSAKLDGSNKNILVEVRHGGGCGEHDYSLKMKGCAESMPVQCQAELVHKTSDFCEAILHRTAVINLAKSGIKGEYYSEGSLTIQGENGSKATVRLPVLQGGAASGSSGSSGATGEALLTCVTHTKSQLTFSADEKVMTLVTVRGETKEYEIVKSEGLVLESLPPVYQTRYKLDDGRSVVVEFRGSKKVGTGYFIRLDGDTSPNFQSCERKN